MYKRSITSKIYLRFHVDEMNIDRGIEEPDFIRSPEPKAQR